MKNIKQQALEIFICLLKEQPPAIPIKKEHEVYLLNWCEEHGVGGFLYKFKERYFTQDFNQYLAGLHKLNIQRNLIYLEEYAQLNETCKSHDIPPFIALKGLSLLQRVHSLGERSLTDIDVYQDSKNLDKIHEVLKLNGYQHVSEKKWQANNHKYPFKKTVMGLEVTLELHTKLFFNQDEQFSPPTISNGVMTILAPDIEIVYLSAHLVHQHTFLKLFWLLDLYQITKNNPTVWNENSFSLAKKFRVKTSLTAVGFCLRNLFGQAVKVDAHFLPMKYFLTWSTLIKINESRIKYLFMKHASKDSFGDALSYDLRWLYFRTKNNLFTNNKPRDINR